MPDLTEQLSSMLSDPQGMEKIRAMAQSLMGGDSLPSAPMPSVSETPAFDISKLAALTQGFKNRADDSRINLLVALKPHLSQEKQTRVDKAVKILKLLELAPLLSKLGIFEP